MRPFYNKMDELSSMVGMDEDVGEYATEESLPMAEPMVAESLNPLWGPNGESLGSTYGVEDEMSEVAYDSVGLEDDDGFAMGQIEDEVGPMEMDMDMGGDMGVEMDGGMEMGPGEEPEMTPSDLRDAYIYRMQMDKDQSSEYQKSTEEENKKTKTQARKLRGI